MLPPTICERLRTELGGGGELTFRRQGAYTQTEQRLSADLVSDVRAALPWGERLSMQIYVPADTEPREVSRQKAARLLGRGHGPVAVADATGLDESSVRRVAQRVGVELGKGAITITDDPQILVAGLAAVRSHAQIAQTELEAVSGLDQSVLSRFFKGNREPDPDTVQAVVEALARKLRCTEHRLRQRALLAGAAVLDLLGEVEVSHVAPVPRRRKAGRTDDPATAGE